MDLAGGAGVGPAGRVRHGRRGTGRGAGDAALPAFVAGLKQGWAFAWRSLLAGELLVIIVNVQSLGVRLHFARELSDAPGLLATMIAILLIGIIVDELVFAPSGAASGSAAA